jgi:putative transposase
MGILRTALKNVQERFPFTIISLCLLPEHLHCIWSLPEGDSNYSLRWSEIKRLFSRHYYEQIGSGAERNVSRLKRREAAIWQRRFWMHLICDENDFENHIHYIHYNPVKHGLVHRVSDWKWSTFHRFVADGFYEKHWGEGGEYKPIEGLFFGE